MEQFIRYQYIMGMISKEDVLSFVPRFITKEQAEDILNKLKEIDKYGKA